jgi:hypothetical protein
MKADFAGLDKLEAFDGRVPIVLGVTGHRNIDSNNDALYHSLREQLRVLKSQYAASSFVILSGLAEGADRLVARLAMEELNAALIAVLPMPREDYEIDFKTAASKEDFAHLITQAACITEASLPKDNPDWKVQGEARNEQYAKAGAIIADHAQVLVAVWDGEKARGTGGTAQIVEWFERGFSPARYSLYENALSPLDPPEPGRALIVDPKTSEVRVVEGPTGPTHSQKPKSEVGNILARTNKYNRDIYCYQEAVRRSYPLAPQTLLKNTAASFTEAAYHAADGLSVHFASNVRSADLIVYCLAMLAFLSYSLLHLSPFLSWVYLGLALAMLLLAARVWFWSIDNRFLEYRSLAEAMRVMFFWRVAGIRRPVWLAYLSRHSGVVHWIRHAVRTLEFCQECLLPRGDRSKSNVTDEGLRAVTENWIEDQIKFFVKRSSEHSKRYRRWRGIANASFAASFLIAAVLAVVAIFFGKDGSVLKWNPKFEDWSIALQVLLGFLAALGLAVRGFLVRRADLELTKQYASQMQIFEIAKKTLADLETLPKPEWSAVQILEKLGQEALQEQAEWLWLRHSRPFEVPH